MPNGSETGKEAGKPKEEQGVLPGGNLYLRTWQVRVGRVTLYLLDSNDPANPPAATKARTTARIACPPPHLSRCRDHASFPTI